MKFLAITKLSHVTLKLFYMKYSPLSYIKSNLIQINIKKALVTFKVGAENYFKMYFMIAITFFNETYI